jgi:NADPH:quinone reductase-like Zn-dependent oxidoreductase
MKAVLVNSDRQSLYIGDWAEPEMGPEDLIVRVKATALNRADLMQKAGKYPPPQGESPILGLEMAGIVERVGSKVIKWKEGDRVCALLPGGGYAEKVKIPGEMAIPIPEGISFEEAAAIPEVFLTAYLNVFMLGGFFKINQSFLTKSIVSIILSGAFVKFVQGNE